MSKLSSMTPEEIEAEIARRVELERQAFDDRVEGLEKKHVTVIEDLKEKHRVELEELSKSLTAEFEARAELYRREGAAKAAETIREFQQKYTELVVENAKTERKKIELERDQELLQSKLRESEEAGKIAINDLTKKLAAVEAEYRQLVATKKEDAKAQIDAEKISERESVVKCLQEGQFSQILNKEHTGESRLALALTDDIAERQVKTVPKVELGSISEIISDLVGFYERHPEHDIDLRVIDLLSYYTSERTINNLNTLVDKFATAENYSHLPNLRKKFLEIYNARDVSSSTASEVLYFFSLANKLNIKESEASAYFRRNEEIAKQYTSWMVACWATVGWYEEYKKAWDLYQEHMKGREQEAFVSQEWAEVKENKGPKDNMAYLEFVKQTNRLDLDAASRLREEWMNKVARGESVDDLLANVVDGATGSVVDAGSEVSDQNGGGVNERQVQDVQAEGFEFVGDQDSQDEFNSPNNSGDEYSEHQTGRHVSRVLAGNQGGLGAHAVVQ